MISYSKEDFEQDVILAKKLQKQHGTSYYFATAFFPREIRDATYALYGFFRLPDEIVDSAQGTDNEDIKKLLRAFQNDWIHCFEGNGSENPVIRAASYVFHTYKIPFNLSEDFLGAMMQDTEKTTYNTYEELEHYMYGSASTVGLIMSYVIGFKRPLTLEYAKKLGVAMQLTNFLRDIGEDYAHRGRIYMPQDELERFGITDEIQVSRMSPQFVEFMKFQVARARALYRESDPGVSELHRRGQLAVRLASLLYERILTKIEEAQYNTIRSRVRTKLPEKIRVSVPVMINHLYNS